MCGILPCTKVKYETRMDTKVQTIYEEAVRSVCCPGYTETPDRKCVPICLKSCLHGKCIAPGVCKCFTEPTETSPGFAGSNCSRFVCLAANRWGQNCDKECECPPTAYCSASTGKCLCQPGWRGVNCSEECGPNSNCENLELPPIIEPEANVLDDNLIGGSSQRLVSEARSMLGDQTEGSEELARSYGGYFGAAHSIMSGFFMIMSVIFIFLIVSYRQQLKQMRNNLYYGPYSTSSRPSDGGEDSESHIYSSVSERPSLQNRPRMPTPLERDYLDKNLSFASATRSILNGKELTSANSNNMKSESRNKIILDQKVESHLISSQMLCDDNVYSELPTTTNVNMLGDIPEDRIFDLPDGRSTTGLLPEESEYQVPKPQGPTMQELLQKLKDEQSSQHDAPLIYQEDSSYYEEIGTKSPSKRHQ